ncbi:hypothetical protein CYMTET_44425 [Cymbomonas tetramitiformis]|uniref:Uncharacterized protein n=1 Tax=Cymbomonas tetramitiformis TaxID=36881 RepID=A0AAE0C2B3_9CHLO|nr:hypothetical protein CYMTET_44425 [Cymbomonas tetramitiformis]
MLPTPTLFAACWKNINSRGGLIWKTWAHASVTKTMKKNQKKRLRYNQANDMVLKQAAQYKPENLATHQ